MSGKPEHDDLVRGFRRRTGLKQSRYVVRSHARRWAVGCALFIVAAGLGGYYYFTRPARLLAFSERYLSALVPGRVQIERASFSIFEGIRLRNVRLWDPEVGRMLQRMDRPIFRCAALSLRHDPIALLSGRLEISAIEADGSDFTVTWDPVARKTNLSDLLAANQRLLSGPAARQARWPRIEMPNTRLTFYREGQGELEHDYETRIDFWAVQRRAGNPAYQIIWRDRTAGEQTGRLQLDLGSGALVFEPGSKPPWLPVEFVIASLPVTDAEVQRWIRLLDLRGDFTVQDLAVGGAVGGLGARGKIVFRRAELSVPVDAAEQDLPAEQRIFALQTVEGYAEIGTSSMHARVEGDLRGRRCQATLDVTALPEQASSLSDSAWDLEISCEDFLLLRNDPREHPVEARAVRQWPAVLKFYESFKPQGRVKVRARLHKPTGVSGTTRLVSARFEARSGAVTFHKFPYRVFDITGIVEFGTAQELRFRDLIGRHGGGRVTLSGTSNLQSGFMDLQLGGRGVALDRDLYHALPQRHRKTWDALAVSGVADVEVRIQRPRHSQPTSVTVQGDMRGGSARFAPFPYPLSNLRGRFRIDNGLVFEDMRAGRGPSQITISGEVRKDPQGRPLVDISVEARQIPIDERLAAAVPEDRRSPLSALNLAGTANVTGRVVRSADMHQADYNFDVRIEDGSLEHEHLAYQLSKFAAALEITRSGVLVRQFEGVHGSAVISGRGAFVLADDGRDATTLEVHARQVPLDESLRRALPPNLARLFTRLRPTGAVDVRLEYDDRAGRMPGGFTAEVTALGNSLCYQDFPLPLTDVRGRFVLTARSVDINSLAARYGPARLELLGRIDYGEGSSGTSAALRGVAQDMSFSDAFHQALPAGLQKVWNKLNPGGRFDLSVEDLRIARLGGRPRSTWSAAGVMTLHGVGINVGLKLQDLRGQVRLEGQLGESERSLSASGTFALDSVAVNRVRLDATTGSMVYDDSLDLFALRNVRSAIYGGQLHGSVVVAVPEDDAPAYDAVFALEDVQLGPFLSDRGGQGASPSAEIEGRLRANVNLSGPIGRSQDRRGRGRVVINDGQMYRLPLLLGILNVINLTIPEQGAFQDGEFDFALRGDDMLLHGIKLYGTALTLKGSGVLSLKHKDLDLELLISSPRQALKIPLLTDLLEGAARELFEVHVHGPLSDPQISTRPLGGLRRSLRLLSPKGGGP